MPYVNCPECGIRSFALAPWSTVTQCPTCDASLAVPRHSVEGTLRHRPDWPQHASVVGRRTDMQQARAMR
jgi:hypothetical protein